MTYKTKDEWKEKRQKDAIKEITALLNRLKRYELQVIHAGGWTIDGHTIYKIDLIDANNS